MTSLAKRINIIGRGNVATHLAAALSPNFSVRIVNPRTLEGLDPKAFCCIIAVSDDAVAEVAGRLAGRDWIVAHTAGSIPLSALSAISKRGVLYPLCSFTKGAPMDYSRVPVFIEGNSAEVVEALSDMALTFTHDVRQLDSDARQRLHLSSVFAHNFANHLWSLAEQLLPEGTDFNVLLPLLQQALCKLETISPARAQTGPAKRGDREVIEKHLEMLRSRPEMQDVYKLLTKSINPNLEDL